jgi:hypothetical protein
MGDPRCYMFIQGLEFLSRALAVLLVIPGSGKQQVCNRSENFKTGGKTFSKNHLEKSFET